MHVVVAGATGMLGTEICRRLRARGHQVTGIIRASTDPARVDALHALGVELRTADLTQPATLPAAVAGADAVVSTVTAVHQRVPEPLDQVDQEGQLRLIEAAADAGVRHFVYTSFSGRLGRDDALTTAKRACEAALRASSMNWTILRPTYFTEVWLSPRLGMDYPNASATVYGAGMKPVSWISFLDVAEVAARAVDHPAAERATIELGGPEALAPLDVVRTFEEATGRSFTVQHVPETVLEEQYRTASEPLARSFAALMLGYAGGDPIPMEETAARYGLQLRSVREYAREVTGQPDTPSATTR